MILNKRTPALWLGFFFFFLSPLFLDAAENTGSREKTVSGNGFSVYAETGTLLVTDDGNSAWWRSGVTFAPSPKFYLETDVSGIVSDLPVLNGSPFLFREQFGFTTDYWGLAFSAGFLSHRSLGAETEKMSFSNKGGQGAFFGIEAPVYLGRLTLVPSFVLGKASWLEGELYWFFGKPEISSAQRFGLSARLEHASGGTGRVEHELSFWFLHADMEIVSNEREHLFDTELTAWLFLYRVALETGKSAFTGTVGGLWAGASLGGELTASNQHYALFPYLFYNVNGSVDAAAGFAALGFRHAFGIFRWHIDLGAVHVFSRDSGEALLHYKKKTLFGGEEVTQTVYLDPGGMGTAFLKLGLALPALSTGGNGQKLFIGLEKIFAVPWGMEAYFSAGKTSGNNAAKNKTLSLVRTALLSGLSIRVSLSW